MGFSTISRNDRLFKVALGIAILVVVYIAWVFYGKMRKLDESVQSIDNANRTQLELEKLLTIVGNYETDLRSYIITRNPQYIANRFLSRGEIELALDRLRAISRNEPEELRDLDSLDAMLDRRFELLRQTLNIARSKKRSTDELNTRMLEGTAYTSKMRSLVHKRIASEALEIKHLNDAHQFGLTDSVISAFLLVLLTLLILLMSFNRLNIDNDQLRKANDDLLFLNHSFNNAEKVAGFGHWKINLKHNRYLFSDNFYRMLGVEPQSFEANPENLRRFMHPDDYDQAMQIHLKSLKTLEPTSIVVRYVLPSGETRYMRSVGSFMQNSHGEQIKVGVNYDITDQYLQTEVLEQHNRELKAINEELESFNNIVSHDLQEPLRKIQMFISRLEEKEADVLSDHGKDYFERIKSAANRMQNLMIDLVNYTRTVKGDKTMVKINLVSLVGQICDDLSLSIEEKKAKVKVGELPVIRAVPFQIEQLFLNLIGNAVKYSRDGVPPVIKIQSVAMKMEETINGRMLKPSEFHKIEVSDNGIGFKQEYAEKIFVLFHRLESDPKYSGTGLGLAICKKIMENHAGFICARSQPGKGTTFSLYLPKNNR